MPLQGVLLSAIIPRVLPWARSFCPFRAYGLELIGSRGCDEAGVAPGSLAGAGFFQVDMREAVLELIAHAGIYLAEGITNLDACFAAKETAAEMVLILPEIVGGVIADVGTIALVTLHDVHRIHTLGMHGGEVLVIDAYLRLEPQSLLVVWIMEEIVAHMEWDADEVVVVSGVPGVAAEVLVQVVALNEADACSYRQLIYDIVFGTDGSRETRSHLIISLRQARHIRIKHTATDTSFCLHLPAVGALLCQNALAAEAKDYG